MRINRRKINSHSNKSKYDSQLSKYRFIFLQQLKQNKVWKYLEENHLFAHTYEQQTMEEKREIGVRRINALIEKQFIPLADVSLVYQYHMFYH